MIRSICIAFIASGALLAEPATAQQRADPPWRALVSASAALKVALDEVCLASQFAGGDLKAIAEGHYLRPINPARYGSPTATEGWRLASLSPVLLLRLPNGGCSVSIEDGDADKLAAEAEAMIQARAAFSPGLRLQEGEAERVAWCTAEAERPMVATIVRRTRGRRVAFLANVFRAQAGRPAFCDPG